MIRRSCDRLGRGRTGIFLPFFCVGGTKLPVHSAFRLDVSEDNNCPFANDLLRELIESEPWRVRHTGLDLIDVMGPIPRRVRVIHLSRVPAIIRRWHDRGRRLYDCLLSHDLPPLSAISKPPELSLPRRGGTGYLGQYHLDCNLAGEVGRQLIHTIPLDRLLDPAAPPT